MKVSELIEKIGDQEVGINFVEKLASILNKKTFPVFNEMFYYITPTGWKAERYYGTIEQEVILSKNKIFKEEDDINLYREINKYLKECSFTPDWDDPAQAKYYIIFNTGKNEFEIKTTYIADVAAKAYFGTEEAAKTFLRMTTKEDVLNYVFGRYFN